MQFFNQVSNRFTVLWRRLVEPIPSVEGTDQRRRARLLASLSLMAAFSIFVINWLLLAARLHTPESAAQFAVAAFSVPVLLINYVFSRCGWNRAASLMIVLYGSFASFLPTFLTSASASIRDLYYLVAMILFGGLFLSVRLTLLIFLLQTLATILLKWFVTEATFAQIAAGPLSFNLFFSTAAILIFHYARRVESERRAQLAASEHRYRSLIENIRDIVYIHELDGTLISVNAVTEKLSGWSRETLIGKSIRDLVHPDDLPLVDKMYQQILNNETLDLFELRILCANGDYLNVEFQSTAQYEDGKLSHVFGVGRDITQRKQIESSLQESQRFIQRVADTAPFMIHVFDLHEQRNVYVNRFTTNFFQRDLEQLRAGGGQYYDTIIHPDDMDRILEYRRRWPSVKDGEVVLREYRMRNPRGEWRWLVSHEIVFLRNPDGSPRQILGLTRDVTDQKNIEDALRDSEEKYRHFMEFAPVAVAVCRLDGEIVYLNGAGARLFGVTDAAHIIGHLLWEFIPPASLESVRQRINNAALGIEIPSHEYQLIQADKSIIQVEGRGTPIRYQWESAALITLSDISERKQADAQKLKLMIERERLSLINRFILAISHDFRTSLATIETSRYLIERRLSTEADALEYAQPKLNTIKSYVDRMAEQLENLHIVYSLNEPENKPVDMNSLLDQLITRHKHIIEKKGLTFAFIPDASVPRAWVDVDKIKVAVNHLLLNAIGYTPDEGAVWVSTRSEAEQVVVEFRDSGSGISAHDLPHIFDLFYRADPARTLDSGGVGLGLSIVQMIVDAHDGEIAVTSELGVGSTFTLSLPAAP